MTQFFTRLFPSRTFRVVGSRTPLACTQRFDTAARALVRERSVGQPARLSRRPHSAKLRSRARPRSARTNVSRVQSTMALDGLVGQGLVGALPHVHHSRTRHADRR
eukprot:3681031-Pyramimonas_sp.AAC.3